MAWVPQGQMMQVNQFSADGYAELSEGQLATIRDRMTYMHRHQPTVLPPALAAVLQANEVSRIEGECRRGVHLYAGVNLPGCEYVTDAMCIIDIILRFYECRETTSDKNPKRSHAMHFILLCKKYVVMMLEQRADANYPLINHPLRQEAERLLHSWLGSIWAVLTGRQAVRDTKHNRSVTALFRKVNQLEVALQQSTNQVATLLLHPAPTNSAPHVGPHTAPPGTVPANRKGPGRPAGSQSQKRARNDGDDDDEDEEFFALIQRRPPLANEKPFVQTRLRPENPFNARAKRIADAADDEEEVCGGAERASRAASSTPAAKSSRLRERDAHLCDDDEPVGGKAFDNVVGKARAAVESKKAAKTARK